MANDPRFPNYAAFFTYYVRAHSHPANRIMHLCGTVLGLAVVVAAIVTAHYWYILLFPVVAYSFAWTGHFLIEKNTPATFGHPMWSFISDFRMLYLMLTGKLGPYLKQEHESITHYQ